MMSRNYTVLKHILVQKRMAFYRPRRHFHYPGACRFPIWILSTYTPACTNHNPILCRSANRKKSQILIFQYSPLPVPNKGHSALNESSLTSAEGFFTLFTTFSMQLVKTLWPVLGLLTLHWESRYSEKPTPNTEPDFLKTPTKIP